MIKINSSKTVAASVALVLGVAACSQSNDEQGTKVTDECTPTDSDSKTDSGSAEPSKPEETQPAETQPGETQPSETQSKDDGGTISSSENGSQAEPDAGTAETSSADAATAQPTSDADGGTNDSDRGSDASSDEAPELTLSNLSPDLLPPSPAGDLRIAGDCTIDTESGRFDCPDSEGTFSFEVVEPEGASRLGVMRVKSLQVDMGGILRVSGALPLVLVADDTLRVFGRITASALKHEHFAGGFAPANGPGAGQEGVFWPSSGGSYCGVGGDASAPEGESPALPGGPTYGNEALIPLLGGSGGGSENGGAGGGALQLVAGVEIQIGITGVVDAGGGGGRNGGGGGGSGGALLLEAPRVAIDGVLAANGGGGGMSSGGSGGSDANTSATAALGEGANNGGQGSSADEPNGAAGVYVNNNEVPGGGGGAGRIRINTSDGTAEISGTISPGQASGCATLGTLP
jgi:hypothetical protein